MLKSACSEGTQPIVLVRTYPMRKAGYSPAFFRANEKQTVKNIGKNPSASRRAYDKCQRKEVSMTIGIISFIGGGLGANMVKMQIRQTSCKQMDRAPNRCSCNGLSAHGGVPLFPCVPNYDGFKSPSLRQQTVEITTFQRFFFLHLGAV